MKLIKVSLVLIFLCACTQVPTRHVQAQFPKQHLAGLDIYGSNRLTVGEVRTRSGAMLDRCLTLFPQEAHEEFYACKSALVKELQSQYQFAHLDLSLIAYFQPVDRPVYGTFDVVEPGDAKSRLDFVKRPNQTFADPDGLIQEWDNYQKIGFDLLERGELTNARIDCPAFHCIFGHKHPALQKYERIFVEGARKNKRALVQILKFDRDDRHRGLAPYVLAYSNDGKELVSILATRLRDESEFVRNNVTRVLADIATYHQNLDLPLEEVIKVLNLPATTDRNKAANLLLGIVSNEKLRQTHRKLMMEKAVPILLKMLRLEQPNNHDPAYAILRLLSDENFPDRDYLAWKKWYDRISSKQI